MFESRFRPSSLRTSKTPAIASRMLCLSSWSPPENSSQGGLEPLPKIRLPGLRG